MVHKFYLKITAPGVAWRISIWLNAELVYLNANLLSTDFVKISNGLYIDNISGINLRVDELFYIEKALQDYQQYISEKTQNGQVAILVIHNFDFALTDYQSEGLYFALVGWLCDEFNIKAPEINYTFNKELNRYVFK